MGSEWTRFSPLVPLAVIGLWSGAQKHSWLNPQVNELQTGIQRTHRVALYLQPDAHHIQLDLHANISLHEEFDII